MSEIFEELKKIIDPKEPGFNTARERWSNFTLGDGISNFLIGRLNETPSPATIEEPVLDEIKKTLSFCEIDNDYGNHQVWMLYLFLRVYQEVSSNKSATPKTKYLPEFNDGNLNKLFSVEGFPDYLKQSPYGLEFVKNLARHISGEKKDSKTSVKFPVVFDPNLEFSENNSYKVVPKLELFKISDESDGLTLHPYNAFTLFDENFLSIFPLALLRQKSITGGGVGTVRVMIENYRDVEKKYNFPILKGNSAGGALATALLSLKYGRIIRNDVALSFAINEKDDLCHKVELPKEKFDMLKDSVNELIVWNPEDSKERTELEKFGMDNNLKLIFCDTIKAALGHATGDTDMILKYLTDFIEMEKKIPLFYKPSNHDENLKYIDQNVNLKEYNVNRRESFSPGEQKREDSERIKSSEILAKTANSNVNLILASSGYGKSFLLKYLALEVATASKDDLEKTGEPKVKIPILISFSDLIKTYDENSDAIKKKYSYSGITEILKFLLSLQNEKLCQKIDSNEVVIFIDSFDDISSDKRKTLLEDLNFFKWLKNQESPVFFSSRPPFDLEGLSKFNLIELELFGEDSKIEFVQNWFGTPEAKNKYNLILKSPLSSIPLLLFFLCKIPERMQKDMNVVSLVKIYNAIVDQMIKESWRNIHKKGSIYLKDTIENDDKKSELANLSYMWFVDERSDIDFRWIKNCGLPKDTKVALIQNNPIFVVNGSEEDQQYSFVHKSIQEFLVALHLAEIVNNTGWESMIKYGTKEVEIQTLIDKKAWLPEWEQVIIFMSGLLNDVYKKDLLGILRGTDDIFRHRLSLAARCLPEVLNNFSRN